MNENRVKRILSEGGLALGTHVGGIADPQIVEIIGLAGFDAAFIDMEHTSYDLHDVQLAVMAAERVGITPIVRTPGFDPAFILRLLDMGVQGSHISNQARIFGLRPEVRNRLNTVYMVTSFVGGAASSALGSWAWARWGWSGVCGVGLLFLLAALTAYAATARGGWRSTK